MGTILTITLITVSLLLIIPPLIVIGVKVMGGKENDMGVKEYELPNGRKAVFEFDENGVGKITLEAMDLLMGLIKADLVKCKDCKWCEKTRIMRK